MNANGWRNPDVYGGGEIQTFRLISVLNEFQWFICSPLQLKNLFHNSKTNITYKLFRKVFVRTNIFTDVVQGIFFTIGITLYGLSIRNKYSIIYSATTNFSDFLPSKILSLLTGKPLVVKYHISLYTSSSVLELFRNYRGEKNGLIDSIARAVLARVSLFFLQSCTIITVSDYLKKQLLRCGLKENQLHLNYNGTDFSQLEEKRLVDVKKEYDLCFMGRVEKSKGVIDFVNALSILNRSGENVNAVMIGDGSAMSEVTSLIKSLNLGNKIQTVGFLGDERYRYLQESRIFVSPSTANEGFGLSILEALYLGVPVLMYDHPVLREVFGRIGNTYFIPPDVNILSDKIRSLLSLPITTRSDGVMTYSIANCALRESTILFSVLEGKI